MKRNAYNYNFDIPILSNKCESTRDLRSWRTSTSPIYFFSSAIFIIALENSLVSAALIKHRLLVAGMTKTLAAGTYLFLLSL